MRVLLDEMLPRKVSREIAGAEHEVLTIRQMGWAGVKNGELLRRATSAGFGVLVTLDRNMEHQQGAARAGIGIVLLIGASNRAADLQLLAPLLQRAIETLQPGEVIRIEAESGGQAVIP